MSPVSVDHVLDLPALPPGSRLHAVLHAALSKVRSPAETSGGPLWPSTWFGLDRVSTFGEASADDQAAILDRAGRALLEEAWFIEKAGLAFAAKMVLLSRSTEERMLYSLFAADEATHFAEVSAWLPEGHVPAPTPFHALLDTVIRQDDREVLVAVIQVVLEGWGLRHYRRMAEGTTAPALAALLGRILQDEARHHGAGAILVQETPPRGEAAGRIAARLAPLLQMVRAGPVGLVHTLEAVLGPIDRAVALRELDAPAHVADRLAVIRGLLARAGADEVLARLDTSGAFAPWEPA